MVADGFRQTGAGFVPLANGAPGDFGKGIFHHFQSSTRQVKLESEGILFKTGLSRQVEMSMYLMENGECVKICLQTAEKPSI